MTVCVDGDTGVGIAVVVGRGVAIGELIGVDAGGGCITSSSSSTGDVIVGGKGAFTSA